MFGLIFAIKMIMNICILRYISLSCIFIFFLVSFIYIQNDEKIYWNIKRKLTWNDFKGSPNYTAEDKAITNCSFQSSFLIKNDSVKIIIKSYMNTTKSWVKNGYKIDYLLNHEQLHFDIAEIYARKFRQKVSTEELNKSILNAHLNKISSEYLRQLKEYQNLYDNETNHSTNNEKQAEWSVLIENQLKSLEAYKDTLVARSIIKR